MNTLVFLDRSVAFTSDGLQSGNPENQRIASGCSKTLRCSQRKIVSAEYE